MGIQEGLLAMELSGGIKIKGEGVVGAPSYLLQSLELAAALNTAAYDSQGITLNTIAMDAVRTANLIMSTLSIQCSLSHPPEDIQLRMKANGTMVYRCSHTPFHEWDLNGHPLP